MANEVESFVGATQPEASPPEAPESDVARWYSGENETAQLGLAVKAGRNLPTDRAVKINDLQAKTGLPQDMVDRNLDEIEKANAVKDFNPESVKQVSPTLARWMSESPSNAAIVRDNLSGVQEIESTVQDYGLMQTMYRALSSGTASMTASAAKIPSVIANAMLLPYNATVKNVSKRPDLQYLFPTNNPISDYYDRMAAEIKVPEQGESITGTANVGGIAKELIDLNGSGVMREIGKANFTRAGRILATQFAANFPNQAVILGSTLLGYGTPALATMGGMQAAQVFSENEGKGKDPTMLTVDALTQGGMEVGFEHFGTFGVLKKWENAIAQGYGKEVGRRVWKDFAKTLAHSFLGEANEEGLTQVGQDFSDYITGINPDAMRGTFSRALDAAILGGASGAFTTGPLAFVSGMQRGAAERQSTLARDFYTQLGKAVDNSKLNEISPQTTNVLINRMVADSPVDKIYVSPEVLEAKITELGQDPLKVIHDKGFTKQYEEAKAAGTQMQIPLADWSSKAGELYQSMADDIKFSPESMSVNEVKALKEQTKAAAAKAEEAAKQPTPEEMSAASVGENITEQLKAAGFDEGTAKTYAQLYEKGFGTLAKRAGIDPAALFGQYGLQIRRPDIQPTAAPGTTEMAQLEARRAELEAQPASNEEATKELAGINAQLASQDLKAHLPKEMPVFEEKATTGEPYAVFDYNWKMSEKTPTVAYFKVFGDPALIKDKTKVAENPGGSGWGSDLSLDTLQAAGIPIKGRTARALGEPSVESYRASSLPTQQTPQGFQGTKAVIQAMRDQIFPAPVDPSLKSIALEDDYVKMKADAADVVNRYAKQRGIEPTNKLAHTIWKELHDALGMIRMAPAKDRMQIAEQIKAQYPTIESDFITLKNQLWSDSTADYYNLFIKDKYQPQHQETFYQSAYHGSPHDFEKFSLKKIGTGEGAQAYGWGLYFAGSKEVAEYYKDNLSPYKLTVKGEPVLENPANDTERLAKDLITRAIDLLDGSSKKDIFDYAREAISNIADDVLKARNIDREKAISLVTDLERKRLQWKKEGKVYEVDIPDDSEYLDYDKKLSEQPNIEKIFPPDVARKIVKAWEKGSGEKFQEVSSSKPKNFYDMTGKELYATLADIAHYEGVKDYEEQSKVASERLASMGVPGIKYLDEQSRQGTRWIATHPKGGVNEFSTEKSARDFVKRNPEYFLEAPKQTSNYVVFDDKLVKVLNKYEQGERGMIRFGQDRQFNIDLLKTADLSTFLHETGHFYLEVLGDLATNPQATEDIKSDLATIYKYLGVESRDQLKREHHEKFARSFEAYLMEGKAPTAGLRAAFARFKSWLTSIYRQIKNLNVELTPEVKDVFDRMLASEEEITAMRAQNDMVPLFADPKGVGMTDEQANQYTKAVLEAKTEAEDALTTKLMKEAHRKQLDWWNTEREKVMKEVAEKVDQDPEQIALSVLGRGEMPDGSPLQENLKDIKLSKKAIVANFPYVDIKKLPKPHVYSAEGGLHPDVAAPLFGYKSGAELLNALSTVLPRKELIAREADYIMEKRHGNLMKDPFQMFEAARKAVHNDKQASLLRSELEYLASNNLPALKNVLRRVNRSIPAIQAVKDQAEAIISEKRVRDIQPSLYQRAENTARREAMEAVLRGDFDTAFEAKKRELLNHELFRSATTAQEQVESTINYMSKFNRDTVRAKLGKAGDEYLDQIDSIMERFDFRRGVSLRALDRRKALVNWVEEQRAHGEDPQISDDVLNEAYRESYKNVPMNVLRGVRDSVRAIEHLASVKNKLLANEAQRNLEEVRDSIVASIAANHEIKPEAPEFAPNFKKDMLQTVQGWAAAHTRMEFLFKYLDGNKPQGATWENIFKPMAEAENTENRMMKEVVENLHQIFNEYTPRERASWFLNRIWIPEINNHMTKANLLSLALNWGNQYNREAVMQGHGWDERQVNKMLDRLDQKDWNTVQKIWDYIDTFWPAAERLEKDLNGIAPEKVEAAPVKTKFGTFAGGYYPIVFDKSIPWRQPALQDQMSLRDMFEGNWGVAMTKHNHLKERTATGGKPILLEMTGLTGHLSDVVHDLAYRRGVIDVYKMINQQEIRDAISAAAGQEMYKQLNPWLKSIAGERRTDSANPVEALLGRARAGATVVNLGLKVTSGLVQTLGYLNTVKELGPGYSVKGLKDTYLKPWKISDQWEFITSRSEMMRDRIENWDRDIRDTMKKLNVTADPSLISQTLRDMGLQETAETIEMAKAKTSDLQRSFFAFVGYMDLGMSVPTWLGAYRKAMDGKVESIQAGDEKAATDYGDMIVRMTQSAGGPKDLASIQRGSEAFKMFTMFYSQLSLQFNQFQDIYNQFRLDRNKASLIGALSLLWFLPAALEDLVRGRAPDDDDKDKLVAWLLRKEALYPAQTVILGRDLANAMDRYLETGVSDFQGSPVFDAFATVPKAASIPLKLMRGEEIKRSEVRAVFNMAGYAFRLPSKQMWMTAQYLYDWMTGDQTPSNPVEGVWRSLVGAKK